MDEDWLEDPSGPSRAQGGSTDPLADREWERLSTRYSDAGYREGITDGKLSTLQQGFDEGYRHAVPPSRQLGRLRGRANALLNYVLEPPPNSATGGPSHSLSDTSHRHASPSLASERRKPLQSGPGVSGHLSPEAHNYLVGRVRQLVKDLGRVRRDDILPLDEERRMHDAAEHGHETPEQGDGSGRDERFELERNGQRDIEGLEVAMEGMSSGRGSPNGTTSQGGGRAIDGPSKQRLREEELLKSLEARMNELEAAIK